MPSTTQKRKAPPASSSSVAKPSPAKKSAIVPKGKPNGSILNFFKKVDSNDGNGSVGKHPDGLSKSSNGSDLFLVDGDEAEEDLYSVYENGTSRGGEEKADKDMMDLFSEEDAEAILGNRNLEGQNSLSNIENGVDGIETAVPVRACTPPPPDIADGKAREEEAENSDTASIAQTIQPECPFMFEEPIDVESKDISQVEFSKPAEPATSNPTEPPQPPADSVPDATLLDEDFIDDEGMELFDEEQEGRWREVEEDDNEDLDEEIGEEKMNRKFMEQQELDEAAFEAALGPVDDDEGLKTDSGVACPICDAKLGGYEEEVVSRHVNGCLDGKPIPLPALSTSNIATTASEKLVSKGPIRLPRPAQANPFALAPTSTTAPTTNSAFSKLMASHAEDRAWQQAATAEVKSRGKRSFERTCPFYKILPNLNVAVDAFRYGAVEGTNAYFLSHFHSDHYIGLSASWAHGPIYCSRVTANLCRRQLRVDPQYLKELEYEKSTEIPGTGGAKVTMIEANHCPGSSLFLFEKQISLPRGGTRMQRILHCGDFRASAKHLRHPLLSVAKKNRIDICYLDTTYMNPKYAFPPQKQVIDVCADVCFALNKDVSDKDSLEKAGPSKDGGIERFTIAKSESDMNIRTNKTGDGQDEEIKKKKQGKLLVVVGTYSIGKERICLGIAEALDCKIYAPTNKQRICAALEDPRLNARLTTDPYAGQVHMTPLMEIRAETLKDYLHGFKPRFTRVVGFRPSGWNYRPPTGRFTESPTVQTILHSAAWKSDYKISQLNPQRGSTSEVKCFGVPYSEHSSFRELTAFCCGLDIVKVIPTVNVGSAKSREKMKMWFEKWAAEKKKNGYFVLEAGLDVL